MNKKTLTKIGAFILAAASLAGCSGVNTTGKSYMDGDKKIYTYSFNMYTQDGTVYPKTKDNVYDNMLKDKFGIEFNYDRIPRTDWETKTNTYFATNDLPDITTGGKEINYRGWANKELLTPVADSYEDLCKKMPNYVKLFGDNMETVYNLAASGDGKLYYLPSVRQEKAQMCWLYREDIFKELGLEFPETTDEFLEVCAKIKAAHPESIIVSSNGQKKSSLTGFFQAFGMPELILSRYSYYDPTTEEFVPYALTTDNAREMYKFLRQLSNNGYIDTQILSMEKDEFSRRISLDRAMITYNYVYNAPDFTKKTNVEGKEKQDALWSPTTTMLTNDPVRGTVFKRDPLYSDWGPAFTNGCASEEGKLDAVLKFYDWAATPEGAIFHTYGADEETAEKYGADEASFYYVEKSELSEDQQADAQDNWSIEKDGKTLYPVVAKGWYDQSGDKEAKSGKKVSEYLGIPSNFLKQPKKFWEDRGSSIEGLYQEFMQKCETDNYYYIEDVPMRYTDAEEKEYTDLATALATKRDEYMARFLIGDMDAANDADWNRYISDMNRVGLDKFIELQNTVYERTQKELSK